MADDDIIKLGVDFEAAIREVLRFDKAFQTINKEILSFKNTVGVVDSVGNIVRLKFNAMAASGEKLAVTLGQAYQEIKDELGNITSIEKTPGKLQVDTVKIEKAKKTIEEMTPSLKGMLAAFIKLGQVRLDNLDLASRKKPIKDEPDIQALLASATRAPSAEKIRDVVKASATNRPPAGLKAGLEAQLGLTSPILSAASQEQMDKYNAKMEKLVKSMAGLEEETARVEAITKAYLTDTNSGLNTQDKLVLKNLRDVAELATEMGAASKFADALRRRTGTAQNILEEQIFPKLTHPETARTIQAQQAFFKVPQPQLFAHAGDEKEVQRVRDITDEIKHLIISSSEISKQSVTAAFNAMGDSEMLENLSAPIRQLVALIFQLDNAYAAMGSAALEASIKEQRAAKETVAKVTQTRNALSGQRAQQIIQQIRAERTVMRATEGQDVPEVINYKVKARLDSYNSNLLSVQIAAHQTALSVQQIDDVFDAIVRNNATGLISAEQKYLYSTIVTLNTAYDKLQEKIEDVAKAEKALKDAEASQNAQAIANAKQALAAQRTGALARQALPSITQTVADVPDFLGKAKLVDKYHDALENLENTLIKVKADEQLLDQARASMLDRDIPVNPIVKQVRDALVAARDSYAAIADASTRATDKDVANTNRRIASANKLLKSLSDQGQKITADQAAQSAVDTAKISAKQLLSGLLAVPKEITFPTESFNAAKQVIDVGIANIADRIDGVKVNWEGFRRAFAAATGLQPIQALEAEERKLALEIQKNIKLANQLADANAKHVARGLDTAKQEAAKGLSAQLITTLPSTAQLKVDYEPARKQAIEYQRALDNLDEVVVRVRADGDILNQAFAKVENPGIKVSEAAEEIAEALVRVDNINKRIIATSEKPIKGQQAIARLALTPTKLPIDFGPEKAVQLQLAINGVVNSINGGTVSLGTFQRALDAANNKAPIEGMSKAEQKLFKDIQNVQNLLTGKKEKDIVVDFKVRVDDAKAAILSVFDINLDVLEPKLAARIKGLFTKAISQYRSSNIDKIQLSDLVAEATKPIGQRELIAPVPDTDALYKTLVDISTVFTEMGSKIQKVGQQAVHSLRDDFAKSAAKAGLSVNQIQEALDRLKTKQALDISFTGITDFVENGKKLIEESEKVGIAFKDEKDLVAKSLVEQTKIVTDELAKQEDRQKRADQAAAARRAKSVLRQKAENAAIGESRKESFPKVEETLTKADPALGRKYDFSPAFNASKESLTALNLAFQAVNNQVVKSGASAEKFREIVARARESLKPGGKVFTEPLAPEFEKLEKAILAADAAMDRAEKSGSSAGKSIILSWQGVFRLFQAQVLHTVLGQMIGDFRQALTAVGEFHTQVGLIKTLTQDLPDTFNQWSDSVARVANEFGKSPVEIATAAYDALSSQITTTRADTEEFLRTASTLARTTGSTTPDAIKVLSAAINGFNIPASQAEDIAAKLFTTVDKGNVRLNDLSTNFGRTTALAKSLGVTFEEVSAALIVLTQTGLSSSQAQTQLNAVMSKLTKPTDAFKSAGFGSGEQLVRTKRLAGALIEISKQAAKGNVELTEFFNELKGEQGVLTLSEDSAKKLAKALEDVNDTAGKARLKQADLEISATPGAEFARQIQVIRSVITDELAGAAVEGINKFTKAFGGLDTVAKSTSKIIINAFGRMGDAANIFGLTMGAIGIGGFAYSIYQASLGMFAFETAIKAATVKMVALGVASKALLLAHPVLLGIAGVAAFSYAMAYLIRNSKEVGIAQTNAFNDGKEAAIAAAKKINEAYSETFRKITDDVKQSIDSQIGLFNGWYDNIIKNVEKAGDRIEDFARDIRSAMDISFAGLNDSFKEGINDIKRIASEAQKSIEDIAQFRRTTTLDSERKDYERRLQAAPDESKLAIASQRAQILQLRGVELLDIGKTQEALKIFGEANGVLDEFRDKFEDINNIQRKMQTGRVINDIQNQFKLALPSNMGQQLDAALRNLNQARLGQVGKGSFSTAEVDQARDRVNAIATRQARALAQLNQPQTSELNNQLQLMRLLTQTGGDEAAIRQRILAIYQQIDNILEARQQKEAEIKAIAEQQGAALQANLRHITDIYDEFSRISLIDKKTGKPLETEERARQMLRLEQLQERLNDSVSQQIQLTAAAKGGKLDLEDVRKRLEFNNLLNLFRENLAKDAENKDRVTALKAAQAQDTDTRTVEKENIVKLIAEQNNYNKKIYESIGILKLLSETVRAQAGQHLGTSPFAGFVLSAGASPAVLDSFNAALNKVNDELAKPIVSVTNLKEAFNEFKTIASSPGLKDLPTNIDKIFGDPEKGKKSVTDFIIEMADAISTLNDRAKTAKTSMQVIEDTRKVAALGALPQAGARFSVFDDKSKSYIEFLDNFTQKSQLIDRGVVNLIEKLEALRQKSESIIPAADRLKDILPSAAEAGPRPEVPLPPFRAVQPKDIPPVTVPVEPQVDPNKFRDQIEQQLKQEPKAPTIYRGQPLGSLLDAATQSLDELVNQQLGTTIADTNQAAGAFSGFGTTAVAAINVIAGALRILNGQITATRDALSGMGGGGQPAQAAATGGLIRYFARGGMVPVMTTPGEVFVSPQLTRKFGHQLRMANYYNSGGFTPRGTDTQPGYLPAGSFVLRKAIANALFGNGNKSYYIDQQHQLPKAFFKTIFAEGGGPIGFTPNVAPRNFTKNDNTSTVNKSLNSTINVNVNGGKTNELTAQEIGKALQRQVRLGLLKF